MLALKRRDGRDVRVWQRSRFFKGLGAKNCRGVATWIPCGGAAIFSVSATSATNYNNILYIIAGALTPKTGR